MEPDLSRSRVSTVRTTLYPYDIGHDLLQEYYREGLRCYLAKRGGTLERACPARLPRVLGVLRWVRRSERLARAIGPVAPSFHSFVNSLAWHLGAREVPPSMAVGQYTFGINGIPEVKICIDTHDSGDLASASLMAESDLYFKTNYWIEHQYDEKVLPLYNCNPLLLPHLETLRAMRAKQARYDFCLIVRVWGGKNEVDGVEHCVRLLEAAARARGRKYLLAYLVAGDTKRLAKRLRESGVPSTLTPMSLNELWQISAESRLNIIRLGMHYCVPWRMCDLLAMGTCPVLDQAPKTLWPVPLREGEHYWTLNLDLGHGQTVASDASYQAVPDLLNSYLELGGRAGQMRHATASYFDRNLQPERIGQQICETVLGRMNPLS